MKHADVIIVGAGAAGLMCAQTAGKRGKSVIVIDSANKAGKKILMSGGGRCNFTNLYTDHSNFLSTNPHFCKSALKRYTPWDFIAQVIEHEIPYHEKKLGQQFCDDSSKDILNMLLNEADKAQAKVVLNCKIEQIKKDDLYTLTTNQGDYTCTSLVIATGGLSIPTLGSSGFGYEVAQQFGHTLLPTRAGLVPFTWNNKDKALFSELSGISLPVSVSYQQQVFNEDMLFTHRGLSGPAILQISSYWEAGQAIEINMLPTIDVAELILEQQPLRPKTELKTLLSELFSKRLATKLCDVWFENKPLSHYKHPEINAIATQIHQWQFMPGGTEGYRTAEVTLGGVDPNQVSSKTLESQLQPGLFFIGEVLDITGHLGGHNFQWAWASGNAAGIAV
jgi:predicted Rossmann fold flavoprotein